MTLTQVKKAGLDEIALDHVFTIGASGTDHYTFQGEGLNGTVNDPTLYLTRGKTYRFEKGSAHPLRIQSTAGASGTAYNTGVTNNGGTGTVIVEVQHDAPDVLYYQCTSHPAMNGILYITGALADGGVTTAKIADDAITQVKLANNAVTTAEINNLAVTTAKLNDAAVTTSKIADDAVTDAKLANSINAAIAANTAKTSNATHTGDVTGSTSLTIANNAVTTAKIADQAVDLTKLPHGTSSNDGKFLRANNGADPSFETVSIPAGTTINNNADNRLITGSGTANTLEGEANATFNGDSLGLNSSSISEINLQTSNNTRFKVQAGSNFAQLLTQNNNDLSFKHDGGTGGGTEIAKIHSNGLDIGNNKRLQIRDFNGDVSGVIENWDSGANALKIGADPANGAGGSYISLQVDGSEQVRIADGIAFNGDSSTENFLNDYEEGTFTPNIQDAASGGNSHGNSGVRQGKYVKIGSAVTVMIVCRSLSNSGLNGSHQLFITNLPFRQSGVERAVAWTQVQYFNNVSNTEFGMHFQINNNETIMRFHKMKDNQGANPTVTFNHWMYSAGYYGFSTTFTYITDQ